jgi:tetratricopeptide (TPR) repeat protein
LNVDSLFTKWTGLMVLAFLPSGAVAQNQLDFSPSLFTVLAAINAAGYDAELQSPSNHPLRQAVRKALASRDIPSLVDLKRFMRENGHGNDARTLRLYISYALAVDGPPSFKFRLRKSDLPPDVTAMEEVGDIMKRFHQEARIDELWKQAQPVFESVLAGYKDKEGNTHPGYHEPVSLAVREANGYLRNPAGSNIMGNGRFQIYLDLLGAPNQFHTRSWGDEFLVVVTSSPELMTDEIRHAYLQFLVGPLVLRYREALEKKKGLGDFAQPAPLLPEAYKQDFLLLTEKSLVRAIETRLISGPGSAAKRQQMVDQALAEGYILTPFFAEALPAYEKQEQSMRFHFQDMIAGIDLKKEDKRLEKVQFATVPVTKRIKTPAAAPEPEPSALEKLLTEGEDLLVAQKLEESRTKFLEVLRQTEQRPIHAKAYYGLARIALRQNDGETGERMFQKSLELEPEPAIKAWCLVYLGRLADVIGEVAQADGSYTKALAVEGISEKARDMALTGLKGGFRRKSQ